MRDQLGDICNPGREGLELETISRRVTERGVGGSPSLGSHFGQATDRVHEQQTIFQTSQNQLLQTRACAAFEHSPFFSTADPILRDVPQTLPRWSLLYVKPAFKVTKVLNCIRGTTIGMHDE